MISIFEELKSVKVDEVVEGAGAPIEAIVAVVIIGVSFIAGIAT